jgi:cyclase
MTSRISNVGPAWGTEDLAGATLTEVAPGTYAWIQRDGSWFINNSGAIAGDAGTVLVDTCATADRTRALLAAVNRATAGQPVTTVINTHAHGDHTFGNCLLPASATVIGHPDTRAALLGPTHLDRRPDYWSPPPPFDGLVARPPTVTGSATVHTETQAAEIHHPDTPPTPRATWPSGCPNTGFCSPATSSSPASRR